MLRRKWQLLLLLGAPLAAVVGIFAVGWFGGSRPTEEPDDPDPRLTFETPYRNVRPDVAYVGDHACAGCHETKALTYAMHPMGRSLAPIEEAPPLERYDRSADDPFVRSDVLFSIERRGREVWHVEKWLDQKGKPALESAMPVRYSLGSGTRGRSYLIEHDGFLFQSPVSWFSEKEAKEAKPGQRGAWDVSPGFEHNVHAHRAIIPGCLFCHANAVQPVAGSVNHYEKPVFQGYTIGCERCHGPGELHVERRKRGEKVEGLDDTIVNPRRLEPALREAVCQQCHLGGEARVQRAGRGLFDYRPGLPLELFLSIFVRPPEDTTDHKSVSQVEQMYTSQCFLRSEGRFGCTSCHDPHRQPEPEERARYFRNRCLTCHENGHKPCSEPLESRRKKDNSCIACHMPPAGSANIAHTAVTDHRLLRDPAKATPRKSRPSAEVKLQLFQRGVADQAASAGLKRDLAVALTQVVRLLPPGDAQMDVGRRVLSLLDEPGRISPHDSDAWRCRAAALYFTGQKEKALREVEALVERLPQAEEALMLAARWTAAVERRQDSRRYWERLIAINPWMPNYRVRFAQFLEEERDWNGAAAQCEAALRTDAGDDEARLLLVSCLLKAGKKDAARQEWKKLQALRPMQNRRYRSLAQQLGDGG